MPGRKSESSRGAKDPSDEPPPAGATLKVTRVGGMLPTLRPSVTHDVGELDAQTRRALTDFVAKTGRVRFAAHAEAMNYVFELESGGTSQKVSCPLSAVPEALRGLIPR